MKQVIRQSPPGQNAGRSTTTGTTRAGNWHERIEEEVKVVITRVKALRDAGWSVIRIVTDHGWLIMPGNLPKTVLPKFLTESRWGRAALVKEGNKGGFTRRTLALEQAGSGSPCRQPFSCFKNFEYSHGGVSLQECVTPILTVSGGVTLSGTVKISDVEMDGDCAARHRWNRN